MSFSTTTNPLEAVFVQRDVGNSHYNQINISGSDLIVYMDHSGSINADQVLVWAGIYGLLTPKSASWASASISASISNQANHATQSIYSSSSLYASSSLYSISSSWASASLSSSFAISASYSLTAVSNAISSSWASSSLQSLHATQSLFATQSIFSTSSLSASYASSSLSSSYAISASYSPQVNLFPNIYDISGSVGINQPNPSHSLDVSGSLNITATPGTTAFNVQASNGQPAMSVIFSSDYGPGSGTATYYLPDFNHYLKMTAYNPMQWFSYDPIYWDSYGSICLNANIGSGNYVGINTTLPSYILDVNGAIGNSNSNNFFINDGFTLDINSNTNSWINLSGNYFGIGTTNPFYTLDVNGDINFNGALTYNGNPFTPEFANTASYLIGYTIPTLVSSSISSSWASSSLQSLHATQSIFSTSSLSSSYASSSISSSYSLTASYSLNASNNSISSSWASSSLQSLFATQSIFATSSFSSSWASSSLQSLHATQSLFATQSIFSTSSLSSSYASSSLSSSYALTASYCNVVSTHGIPIFVSPNVLVTGLTTPSINSQLSLPGVPLGSSAVNLTTVIAAAISSTGTYSASISYSSTSGGPLYIGGQTELESGASPPNVDVVNYYQGIFPISQVGSSMVIYYSNTIIPHAGTYAGGAIILNGYIT